MRWQSSSICQHASVRPVLKNARSTCCAWKKPTNDHNNSMQDAQHEPTEHARHRSARSLLAKEEVWQEVGHVLVELVLRWQQHRLIVDQQQQHVEEEEEDNRGEEHGVRPDALLLGGDAGLAVQGLQQVAQ